MTTEVVVFGSGGFAKELLGYLAEEENRFRVLHCVSTEPFNSNVYNKRYEVRERADEHYAPGAIFLVAVADPRVRRKLARDIYAGGHGHRLEKYVHPTCTVSRYARIGAGCILAPQAIVVGDAVLDEFVFLNTNATVGHDSRIGAFTTMFPNTEVCGDCSVGEDCMLGIGSYVLPGHKIGPRTKVSAGSFVRHDFPEGDCTLQGNPATKREMKS